MTAADYRFALRPKWVFGHAIALIAVLTFVLAGFWQLARLEERQDRNALVLSRAQGNAVALPSIVDARERASDFEWQLVEFEARWRLDDEVILQAQTLSGLSGHDVLTPAATDGATILVDRGWVPIDVDGPPVSIATPFAESVTVRGVLRLSQQRGSLGPVDPPAGVLDRISRVDVGRLDAQISGPLYPMWVQLLDQSPPQTEFPRMRPLPSLDEGPHLSYAVQWFIFAAIVTIGYPVLLIRTARPVADRTKRRPDEV